MSYSNSWKRKLVFWIASDPVFDNEPIRILTEVEAAEWRASFETEPAPPVCSNGASGLLRLERSRAQTPKDLKRLSNAIIRDAIGRPLTRAQRAEQRPPKLEEKEIDKNCYRAPLVRERSPRDMSKRRAAGWAKVQFVLPGRTIEGLKLLAKGEAIREQAMRSRQPRGFRRRYPKTKNFYVVKALNRLFQEHGLSQFCVEEAKPVPGRVPRFVVSTD
jgi:hypothetical protein